MDGTGYNRIAEPDMTSAAAGHVCSAAHSKGSERAGTGMTAGAVHSTEDTPRALRLSDLVHSIVSTRGSWSPCMQLKAC